MKDVSDGVALRSWNGLSICSGIGGLDLGLHLALGGAYRAVGFVERDAYAAALLVARMGIAGLDRAVVWDDLTSFDGRPWRGRVDLISGGFPCQPFSKAGARRGAADPRHIWPHIRRVVDEVRPGVVLFENVPNLINIGLREVCADLVNLGYRVANDAQEPTFGIYSAEEVGAPHRRDRLFILGYTNESRLEGRRLLDGRCSDERTAGSTDGAMAASWPPRPDDAAGWRATLARDPSLEPALCRLAHGIPARVDQLRCLGNAVVPAVAAHAFLDLARRAFGG